MSGIRCYILFIFVLSCNIIKAQDVKRTWNWYSGYYSGIGFSTGYPVPSSGQLHSNEAAAAISDRSSGLLLFYTDGVKVWNRNHSLMPNGTGLMGCNSSTQGALIVPKPGSDSLYYLFTTDCYENNLLNGLRYSIVDMSGDGGMGDVVQKNILLRDSVTERLTGTYHSNGNDVWIIGHDSGDLDFYAYLITAGGIDTNAVLSTIGTAVPSDYACIKTSPDGSWLGLVNYAMGWDSLQPFMELFRYNDNTGAVDSFVLSDTSMYMYNGYGLSFSPDNTKLYVAGGPVFQYDLDMTTPAAIKASRQMISGGIGLQLAPDGKIYVSTGQVTDTLWVINSPNSAGLSCNYGFGLQAAPNTSFTGLPNFIESYFNGLVSGVDDVYPGDNSLIIYPNPAGNSIKIIADDHSGDEVQVLDLTGRTMLRGKMTGETFTFDISGLPTGIYFVNIIGKHVPVSRKLIVAR